MANVRARKNKEGEITSYLIRVFRGRDKYGKEIKPYAMTLKVPESWSERKIQTELNKQVVMFEKSCKEGIASNDKQTFETYSTYVLDLKENVEKLKHRTIKNYKEMLPRINAAIGHMKLSQLRPQHLNKLYEQLTQKGVNLKTGGYLSPKTIIEYHRLIHVILKQATKELIVPYNAAALATPPANKTKEANYLEIEDIENILHHLENEPLKWQVVMHLLIFTGGRRGEVAGLKEEHVDIKNCTIKFSNNLLYTSTMGLYEDSLKTEASKRSLKIPKNIMQGKIRLLLKENKENRVKFANQWAHTGYLLTQIDGHPMHPDSITQYCSNFRTKYNAIIEKENAKNPKGKQQKLLPRMNPHAFRHSQASILFFNGVDPVTVSKRLGHAKVSTTTDIYSHILEKADTSAADILDNVFIRSKNVV